MKSQLIETQPTTASPAIQPGEGFLSGLRTTCGAITIFIMVSAVIMIIYNRFSKRSLHLIVINPNQVTPCRRCQYLGDNSHLRCALHPSIVLTEQAIDCQDYHLNTKERIW
jgi:hypothetical protein